MMAVSSAVLMRVGFSSTPSQCTSSNISNLVKMLCLHAWPTFYSESVYVFSICKARRHDLHAMFTL